MIRTSSASIVAAVMSCSVLVAVAAGVANAAEIKVLSAVGVKPVMVELIPQFEQSSGHRVRIDYGTWAPLWVAFKKVKAPMS